MIGFSFPPINKQTASVPVSALTKMAFAEEVAVFAETNLGTRIVMTVPLDITAREIKRKIEKTHARCLPSLGEIRVHGLMVKRKSKLYYLAESVAIKYVFRDNQKPWFIHAEARLGNGSHEPSISNRIDKSQIRHCSGSDKSIEGVIGLIQGENKKIKKSKIKPSRKPDSCGSGKSTEGVIGLIQDENKKIKKSRTKPSPKPDSKNLASGQACLDKREFLGPSTSDPETITRSSLSIARAAEMKNSKCFNSLPEREPGESVSKSETISNKLIVAANNIRMQGKSHMSSSLSSSIFRSKTRRKRSLDGKTLASLVKFMVFEIPNTEE